MSVKPYTARQVIPLERRRPIRQKTTLATNSGGFVANDLVVCSARLQVGEFDRRDPFLVPEIHFAAWREPPGRQHQLVGRRLAEHERRPDSLVLARSEERRVGKECRARWSRY